MLWIERLEAVQNLILALVVVERLPAEFHLTIVGAVRLRSRAEERLERRGRDQITTTFGPAVAADVLNPMRRHSVGLMTSHSEGHSRTLVEVLALNRPAVTTKEADTGRPQHGNLMASPPRDVIPRCLQRVSSGSPRQPTLRLAATLFDTGQLPGSSPQSWSDA